LAKGRTLTTFSHKAGVFSLLVAIRALTSSRKSQASAGSALHGRIYSPLISLDACVQLEFAQRSAAAGRC